MTMPGHDPAQQPQQAASPKPASLPGPRTGPIIWGAMIIAFCGYVAQRVFGGPGPDGSWWLIASVLGLGVLLLGVGIAVILRNRRN